MTVFRLLLFIVKTQFPDRHRDCNSIIFVYFRRFHQKAINWNSQYPLKNRYIYSSFGFVSLFAESNKHKNSSGIIYVNKLLLFVHVWKLMTHFLRVHDVVFIAARVYVPTFSQLPRFVWEIKSNERPFHYIRMQYTYVPASSTSTMLMCNGFARLDIPVHIPL